jgi:hypothetical protein
MNIGNALHSLRPESEWVVRGNDIEWLDKFQTQPSRSEIDEEIVRLQAKYDTQEYARNRKAEYPSVNELVVALWEGVVEERMAAVTSLEGKRQAVKAKYPK